MSRLSCRLSLAVLFGLVSLCFHVGLSQAWVFPPYLHSWGSRGSAPGQFNSPWGLAVDALGNVLVVDTGNARVQVFTAAGQFLRAWSTIGSGYTLNIPLQIAVAHNGHVFLNDNNSLGFFEFTPHGTFVRSWNRPPGIGLYGMQFFATCDSDYVYGVTGDNVLIKFNLLGEPLLFWRIPGGTSPVQAMAIDRDGNILAAKCGYVLKLSPGGTLLWTYAFGCTPILMCTDPAGNVWCTQDNYRSILVLSPSGGLLGSAHNPAGGNSFIPEGIALDASGMLFIVDRGDNRIDVFGPASTGARPTTWGHLKALYR